MHVSTDLIKENISKVNIKIRLTTDDLIRLVHFDEIVGKNITTEVVIERIQPLSFGKHIYDESYISQEADYQIVRLLKEQDKVLKKLKVVKKQGER